MSTRGKRQKAPWAQYVETLLVGKKKKAVAEAMGVDPSAFSRFLHQPRPWPDYVPLLSRVLNKPEDEVFPPRLFQNQTGRGTTSGEGQSVEPENKNRAAAQPAQPVIQPRRTADVPPPTLGQIDEGLMASSSSVWGRSFIRRCNEILDVCEHDEAKLEAAFHAAEGWLKGLRSPEGLQPDSKKTGSQ